MAAGTCLCNGQTYDPVTACCTASGVVQKNPIANLAACPNKVADPTHTCIPNGCGGQGGVPVPNSYGIAEFRSCCNTQDCCYDTCNGNKANCDLDLFACISGSCAIYALFPTLLPSCLTVAAVYYAFVASPLGSKYFTAAQQQACDCCGTQTCPQSCAGGGLRSASTVYRRRRLRMLHQC
jgi:secretory phospholipase A2